MAINAYKGCLLRGSLTLALCISLSLSLFFVCRYVTLAQGSECEVVLCLVHMGPRTKPKSYC